MARRWTCTADGQSGSERELPPELKLSLPAGAALHLSGSVEGPLGGLGPSLRFDAWFADAQLRADLHYEEEDRPRHEVLLWTPQSVLLFDRDRGGLSELSSAHELPAWGAEFSLASLMWICLGRWPGDTSVPRFQLDGRDWSAREGLLEIHGRAVDRSGQLTRSSLRWMEEGGKRELSAIYEVQLPMLGGQIPRRVRLDGDDLEMEIQLRLDVQVVENASDSIFDPLADP
jgi:hypothetical protein